MSSAHVRLIDANTASAIVNVPVPNASATSARLAPFIVR